MKRYGLNKWLFRLISLTVVLALLFTSAGTGIAQADPDPGWYDANWAYRKIITTDHDRVGIASDLSSDAASGQKDVVVKDGSLFSAGESVVIKDDNNRETNIVESVSVNTLTMQNNLQHTYTTAAYGFVKNVTDSTDLTNFPVLINRTDADWKDTANVGHVGQSDGGDILFTSSNGTTKIDHEIEKYTPSTGELIAWVEVPTLSASADTEIYMYYGNATCADQWNVAGTWDEGGNNNFKMVQHLKDETTSTTTDSTSNSNDGTKKSDAEPIEADGKIGKGQDFSDDYITVSDSVELRGMSALTIEAWIYADTKTNWACILEKADEKEDERKFHPQQIRGGY